MNISDAFLTGSIILGYNIFAHALAAVVYKDYQYTDKIRNTSMLLIILGIVGIIIANYINNNVISYGIFYGAVLLITSIILANWNDMSNEVKLFVSSGIFGIVLWYSFNKDKNQNQNQNQNQIN